jgi:16S rRNA (guanine527-N7)-methyltransferase
VSRAVAPLSRLVEWCEPLMIDTMVAVKGENAQQEVGNAASLLRRKSLDARVVVLDDECGLPPVTVVQITRIP